MFTYSNRTELAKASLLEHTLVQLLGTSTEGDSPVRIGRVYSSYSGSLEVVTLANGYKVVLNPEVNLDRGTF